MPAAPSILGQCGPCCTPTLSYSAASLTGGSQSVGGWSSNTAAPSPDTYDPAHPTDWTGWGQLWRFRYFSGGLFSGELKCADCPGADAYDYGYTRSRTFSGREGQPETGSYEYGVMVVGFAEWDEGEDCAPPPTTSTTTGDPGGYGTDTVVDLVTITYDYSTRTNCADLISVTGTASIILGDAIGYPPVPSSGTAGTSACALTPAPTFSFPLGPSGGLGALTVTGQRRVTLTVSFRGAPITDYRITFTFVNTVASTAAALANTTEDVDVTTDGGGSAAFTYDIPQPDWDRQRCFAGTWSAIQL